MKLIYILPVGESWNGEFAYEFLFTTSIDKVDGDKWNSYPAAGKPSPPHKQHIKAVGKITTTDYRFDVIQNSDTFSVYDAVDGIISLGWENIDGYEEYPETRLSFRFGDDYKSVKEKLQEKGITMDFKEITNVDFKRYDTN